MGVLSVVAWNMAARRGQAQWSRLDDLAPDVALLTEARVPDGRTGVWRREGTEGLDGKVRPWSAAVLSPHETAEITTATAVWRYVRRRADLQCSRRGTWIATQVMPPGGIKLTAIALYGLLDRMSDTSVHLSLSELGPILDDPKLNKYLVLAGDLNTGTQWPADEPYLRRDRNLLERFETIGLVDCARKMASGPLKGCQCIDGPNCRHVRTRRDPRHPDVAYQTDYLFASPALAERLTHCDPLCTDDWFKFSDHAPIHAEFDL